MSNSTYRVYCLTPLFIATLLICGTEILLSKDEIKPSLKSHNRISETITLKIPAALFNAGYVKFAAAVQAAGLTATLEEEGPFTCFAPSDKAFDRMPEKTKKLLEENPMGEDSKAWIKYHFVKDVALTRDDLGKIPGANGFADKYLRVWVTPEKITINRICEVTRFDIKAANGIIHEVSRVLDADDEMKAIQKKNP